MIDALSNVTPQPVAVEGPIDAGKQASSADSSFTDVLNAAVAGEQETSDKEALKVDAQVKPEVKSDGEAVVASEIAGAVQVAMVVPVQANVAIAVEAAPQVADEAVVAEVSAEVSQPVQSPVPQAVQAPQVGQTEMVDQAQAGPVTESAQTITAVEGRVLIPVQTPSASDPKAEPVVVAQTVQAEVAQTVAQDSTLAEGQPVPTEQPVSVSVLDQKPIQADKGLKAESKSAQSDVPKTTHLPTQPVVSADPKIDSVKQDKQPDTQAVKPEKSNAAAAAREINPVAVSKQANIAVDTVPVQWKFDATMQGPRILTTAAAADMLVGSIGDSSTKPAGGESGSASGQGSTDSQAAMPMGLQFTAQLNKAAQQTATVTSASDLNVRVIDQVVREVRLSQINGQSNLVVKLNPPDLGALRLQISQDATGMTTHIQASNSQVRGLLEANMPLLMDTLSKAGVQMNSVSVSVGTSFNAFAQNAQQGNAQSNSSHARGQYAPGRQMGGIQTAADFAPAWGRSEQAGYSWLA